MNKLSVVVAAGFFAGCFGGLIAIVVIALLPNRAEEQAETIRRQSEQDAEIAELKNRIRDLEAMSNTQEPAVTEADDDVE